MKKYLVLAVFICLLSDTIIAQTQYIDSVIKSTENQRSTELVATELKISDWYRLTEEYDKAIAWGQKAELSAAQLTKDKLLMQVKARFVLANIFSNMSEFSKSRQYVDAAAGIAAETSEPLTQAYAFFGEAILQFELSEFDKSVENLLKTLSSIPSLEEEPYLASRMYYILYCIYTEWNDEKKSYDYSLKSIEYAEKSGNKNMLANAYNALSVSYTYKYNSSKQPGMLDSTMLYLEKIADLYKAYPGEIATNTYAIARINKASYYMRYYNLHDAEIKKKIQTHIDEALQSAKLLVNNEAIIASGYGMLSELSKQNNDLNGAEKYLMVAYGLMQSKENNHYHTLVNITKGLADLNVKRGNYKKAYEFLEEANQYAGKLFDENQAQNTRRLEAQFEAEKKNQEVKALVEKTKSLQKEKWLFMGIVAASLVGFFFMFRSYHFRLRYSMEREKKLETEKHETELQIQLEQEERARMDAERQLMTLQQQQLQNKVMANELQLEHKNEVLQQLKDQLQEGSGVNIKQILREESVLDGDFENARFRIEELHPQFFKTLNEKSLQKLTPLDLKYCAYLYLGLDTKQIAGILHVEPKSVRMTKYRLKQKFELDKETDLYNFLQKMAV